MSILQLGLVLNIAGTILIFFNGFPSKIIEDSSSGLLSIGDLEEAENNKRIRRNRHIRIWGYIGMGMLIVGFVLQFADTVNLRGN